MDFTLIQNADTGVDMSFDQTSGLANNVYLSVTIELGSWWAAPVFGRKKRERIKNTAETARLIQKDFESALQWLLDSYRARAIVVTVSRDPERWPHQLRVWIEVTASDGTPLTDEYFVEVV